MSDFILLFLCHLGSFSLNACAMPHNHCTVMKAKLLLSAAFFLCLELVRPPPESSILSGDISSTGDQEEAVSLFPSVPMFTITMTKKAHDALICEPVAIQKSFGMVRPFVWSKLCDGYMDKFPTELLHGMGTPAVNRWLQLVIRLLYDAPKGGENNIIEMSLIFTKIAKCSIQKFVKSSIANNRPRGKISQGRMLRILSHLRGTQQ